VWVALLFVFRVFLIANWHTFGIWRIILVLIKQEKALRCKAFCFSYLWLGFHEAKYELWGFTPLGTGEHFIKLF
jgi:hypothetical protein